MGAAGLGGAVVSTNRIRITANETFLVIAQTGGKVAFKAANGKFLSAPANGGVLVANAAAVTALEAFVVV